MRFGYIVDYLCGTAGPSLEGLGVSDERVNKRTEAGMAEALRRYVCGAEGDEGNDYFRVDELGMLHVFNGRYFEMMNDVVFTGIVREVMRRCGVGIVYLMDAAERVAKYCIAGLSEDGRHRFEPDRRYVCFRNCVLDLRTQRVTEHGFRYCTDIIFNFDYDASARSGLWDRVLGQTIPDEGSRRVYQQFCGAFLIDRAEHKFEYICFLMGEGQNGKSIVAKAVVNVFKNVDETGRQVTKCVTTFTPDQLFRSAQMDYHMAEVNGKIMNYCDDVSDKDFSGGDFKAFVSGGEFTGRSPYSREMTYVTKVPLMLCCANRIPPTTDDSDGYFRRFLVIYCPNKVAERDRDPQLEAKLRDDRVRSAIFNWMLDGYRELIAHDCKIEITDEVRRLKEDMKADSNSARRWIREYGYEACVPNSRGDSRWKAMRDWMAIYQGYCKEYGEAPKTAKAVGKIFEEMGFLKERRSDGTWWCIGQKVIRGYGDEAPEEDRSAFGLASNEDDMPF